MPTCLVTLATGQQGRATIAALLRGGAKVHAVVRDITKEATRELEAQGVVLFKGGNDAFEVFGNAAKGCKGLFLNLVAWPDNLEPGRQASGILEACREAGIEHVVASTSSWVGNRDKWDNPLNEKGGLVDFCKHEALVEDAVRRSGIKNFTILRPSWFHSNYLPPVAHEFFPELLKTGELVHSFKPGATMPHINVDDIGRFAAMALFDPITFGGQEIELGSENLTIGDVADAIQKAIGRHIPLRSPTLEETEKANPVVPWQLWASTVDLTVDSSALERKYNFHFTTLEDYLTQEKSRLVSLIQS